MLLTEKMKEKSFSTSEESIIQYMFEKRENIRSKTVKQLANETYTHPSTLIRIGKKLGYNGWVGLRDAFLKEIEYLNSHFNDIDANLPFNEHDNMLSIANKIAYLNQTTIADTLSLINIIELQRVTDLLKNATSVKMFSENNNLIVCYDFKTKMTRIGKKVDIIMVDPEYEVASSNSETPAIVISYSGENKRITSLLPILKKRNIPIIALTSIGDNTLSKSADCILKITTRERLYSKIGSFSLNDSICFLLDVLYACVFSENYKKNLEYIANVSKSFDSRRTSNEVMKENN